MISVSCSGDYDCMDWSDELVRSYGESCPSDPNAMDCDEHLCRHAWYSCGDGECILWQSRLAFQRLASAADDCFNKRNLNYMCEVGLNAPAWTLESGLCWPEKNYDDERYPPWSEINSSKLIEEKLCEYLVRCLFSDGFEYDCPCDRRNCSSMLSRFCTGNLGLVLYPPQGLISANLFFFYNLSDSANIGSVNVFRLDGNLRCRGFYQILAIYVPIDIRDLLSVGPDINSILCDPEISPLNDRDFESPLQYNKFCWNDSFTFNSRPYAVYPDACHNGGQCISQYRIRDGYDDCVNCEDEDEDRVFEKNYCTESVGRHHFQCFRNESKCLTLYSMGTGIGRCSNNYDEFWYDSGLSLQEIGKCNADDHSDCGRWKDYITQSSLKNFIHNSSDPNIEATSTMKRISFRSYCDSFWDFEDAIDESPSFCRYWICLQNQYQCKTGQCIALEWVCDGEWDCADASDEEAIVLIRNWSLHNQRLDGLQARLLKCRERYSNTSFSNICNTSFEFGCYRSAVLNPLDILSNRPCINLTQIGDGVEHCYNAYDEKNTLKSNSRYSGMWGFQFRCGNAYEQYRRVCSTMKNNCTQVLCSNQRDPDGHCSGERDVFCLEENQCVRGGKCDGKRDCLHGEDEYWCASDLLRNQLYYRNDKDGTLQGYTNFNFSSRYLLRTEAASRRTIRDVPLDPEKPHVNYSYVCNRGVSILELNETRCVCPPAYYGHRCQFFSDRISIIAQLDQKTLLNKTLKINAYLLFRNATIDSHEFDVIPAVESVSRVKHRFYLLYSRSGRMIEHKQWRYFNRTDIIDNHPYSVHFDVFASEDNQAVKELGSWRYPIYFDYLPAFRLAVVLRFPSWFGNTLLDPCHQSSCNSNSTCCPIFNQNRTHYCSCNEGRYGKECSLYESRCDSYCSSDSFCRVNYGHAGVNDTKIVCVCPPGHFGRRCYLKHDDCNSNPCSNGGTCFQTHSRSETTSYRCICSTRFYGKTCEKEKASVRLSFNMTAKLSIRASAVQLYDIETSSLTLLIQHQEVYHGIPSMLNYLHPDVNAPYLGLLKTYDNLERVEYFILYTMLQPVIDIDSVPQQCPHTSLLLPKSERRELIVTC
jgi:hypothetical protein